MIRSGGFNQINKLKHKISKSDQGQLEMVAQNKSGNMETNSSDRRKNPKIT